MVAVTRDALTVVIACVCASMILGGVAYLVCRKYGPVIDAAAIAPPRWTDDDAFSDDTEAAVVQAVALVSSPPRPINVQIHQASAQDQKRLAAEVARRWGSTL